MEQQPFREAISLWNLILGKRGKIWGKDLVFWCGRECFDAKTSAGKGERSWVFGVCMGIGFRLTSFQSWSLQSLSCFQTIKCRPFSGYPILIGPKGLRET